MVEDKMKKISGLVLLILGVLFVVSFFISSIIVYILYKETSIPVIIGLFILLFAQGILFILVGRRVMKKAVIHNSIVCNEEVNQLFNADWYYDDVIDIYCNKFNKKFEELTDKDYDEIYEYTSLDASFILTWLIENDYYIIYDEDTKKHVDELKNRTITGYYFLSLELDYRFFSEDFNEEIIDFINYFFENSMFDQFLEEILKKEKYCIKFNWEDYDKFKIFMDEKFKEYNELDGE